MLCSAANFNLEHQLTIIRLALIVFMKLVKLHEIGEISFHSSLAISIMYIDIFSSLKNFAFS